GDTARFGPRLRALGPDLSRPVGQPMPSPRIGRPSHRAGHRRPHAPAGRRVARLALRAGPLRSRRGVALASGTERRSTGSPLPGGSDNRMTLLRPALVAGLWTFVLVLPCAAQRAIATNVPKPISIPLHELQTPYGQRTDAFRRLLFELRFQPLSNVAQLQANPSESILILLGEPSFLSKGSFPQGL